MGSFIVFRDQHKRINIPTDIYFERHLKSSLNNYLAVVVSIPEKFLGR